ncbi:MAG: metalloregulator ArsR/SmtB family transcription factor [Bacteroidota bacterium]
MDQFTSRIPFAELETSANKLKSIAHPVRIAILDLLRINGKLTVTEIQESLNIEQTATSYHLIQMKNKKIVRSEKKANKMFYSISNNQIPLILDIMLSE